MGKMSRRKGIRVEYLLRDYLRNLGYEAVRVPLSGASQGYKHDVVARKDSLVFSFEMKARKELFKNIYKLMYHLMDEKGTVRFVDPSGVMVALGTDFEDVRSTLQVFPNIDNFVLDKSLKKVFNQIMKLDKLREGADFLVIKDNNHPLVFIKYWV